MRFADFLRRRTAILKGLTRYAAALRPRQLAQHAIQKGNTLPVLIYHLTLKLFITGYFVYLMITENAWQHERMVFLMLSAMLAQALGLRWAHRRQEQASVWLLHGILWVIVLAANYLYSGVGFLLGTALIVITLVSSTLTLPYRQTILSVAVSFSVGALLIALDRYGPADRLELADFNIIIPLGILASFGFYFAILAFSIHHNRMQQGGMRIRSKLTLSFLIVSLLPLVLIAVVDNQIIQQALTQSARQALLSKAVDGRTEIDIFLSSVTARVESEAQLPDMYAFMLLGSDERKESLESLHARQNLRALSRQDPIRIISYAVLDSEGINILDTVSVDVGQSEAHADYFREPMETAQSYISPLIFSQEAGEFHSIFFSSPIRNPGNGDILGVLRVRYNASVLQEIVRKSNDLAGEDSFGVLFQELDGNYLHIAHGTSPEVVFTSVMPYEPAQAQALQDLQLLPQGSLQTQFSGAADEEERRVAFSYPDLQKNLSHVDQQEFFITEEGTSSNMDNQVAVQRLTEQPDWIVAFFQPRSTFLRPAMSQARISYISILVLTSFAVGMAVLVSKYLSRPILGVTRAAAALAAGDFSADAPVMSGDEIGQLAKNFNLMRDQLRDLVANLESTVAARTAEINEKKQYLEALVNTSPIAIVTLDGEDQVQTCNLAFEKLFGYTRPELRDLGLTDAITDASTAPQAYDFSLRVRGGKSVHATGKRRTKSGELLDVEIYRVPVMVDGRQVGALGLYNDITQRLVDEEQLRHNALHDEMTGLPNREFFLQSLQERMDRVSRQHNETMAVIFIDLDRLKLVNDSLGHSFGDQLLIQVARRLGHHLRPGDMVARLGGDEFAIMLGSLNSQQDAQSIARRILGVLERPMAIEGHQLYTSASAGIVNYSHGYYSPEELLRDADLAMYSVKREGGNGLRVFGVEMHVQAVQQQRLENDLRNAIRDQEFVVHYQPIISLHDQRLAGFEALVRWQHPQKGLISPAEFIPIAEQTGQIVVIDQLVIEKACMQLAEWQTHYPSARDLWVTVNLSSRHFGRPDLFDHIAFALESSNLPPSSLILEITESNSLEDFINASTVFEQLAAMGVHLSMDDFGTGHSTLSYMHRFPFQSIKIDQSFLGSELQDKKEEQIISTIVTLAHSLDMEVVAEGVEHPSQMNWLQQADCDYAQGYLISYPLPAADIDSHFTSYPVRQSSIYFHRDFMTS